jgi:hypothetical protein
MLFAGRLISGPHVDYVGLVMLVDHDLQKRQSSFQVISYPIDSTIVLVLNSTLHAIEILLCFTFKDAVVEGHARAVSIY